MKIAQLVLAGLIASASVAGAHAATLSVAKPSAQDALVLIKKKKKKDKAGHCGEHKYFDKKEKKCADARKKKK